MYPLCRHSRQVREVLLRGLQSFPAEPGMLCLLLDAEEFSGSQQRLVHHFFEASLRLDLKSCQFLMGSHVFSSSAGTPMIRDPKHRLRSRSFLSGYVVQ